MVAPAQTGVLLPAVGVVGTALTTTIVVATGLVQPATVTVKLYVPAIANVAAGRVGSSNAEVNAAGPVHDPDRHWGLGGRQYQGDFGQKTALAGVLGRSNARR